MVWKPIKGYEDSYEVSTCGKVRSIDRIIDMGVKGNRFQKGVILKPSTNRCGYMYVCIKGKSKKIHRLVAENFLDNPLNKREVNHIDGNKSNNNVCNLEWCTRSENVKHSFNIGLRKSNAGNNNPNKKLSVNNVLEIRELYRNKEKTQVELSKMFGVGQNTISEIVRYESWKDVE